MSGSALSGCSGSKAARRNPPEAHSYPPPGVGARARGQYVHKTVWNSAQVCLPSVYFVTLSLIYISVDSWVFVVHLG